jgi:myo-inositol 2-dehydrogenase/D-chiro-inositol 1-dehydrogenase
VAAEVTDSRSAELTIGLAGCGRLAQLGWLPALSRVAGVRLTALADPDPSRCSPAPPGTAIHTSASEMIEAGRIDGVIVATPAASHVAYARQAAEAGVACLVEKPPAPDLEGALELAALEPAPWIGFNRRFAPEVGPVRESVPEAEPVRLDLRLHYRRASWAPFAVADDALLDLGPHLIDLAGWLARASVSEVRTGRLTTTRARLELRFAGTRGGAHIDCATDRLHHEIVAVEDEAGRRIARHSTGGWTGAITGRLRPPSEHPLVASLAAELESFAAAVRGERRPELGTARDGVAVMAAIEAARRSAARGGGWEAAAATAG